MPTKAQRRRETRRTKRPNFRAEFRGAERRIIVPGVYPVRLDLLQPGRVIPLDEVVEGFTWQDDEEGLTGTLDAVRPTARARDLPIRAGDRIRCLVSSGGVWDELWRMAVKPPSVDRGASSVGVELADDLVLLRRNRRDWSFRKTKDRGRGWYAHEIAEVVARREGFRLGAVARGTKRIDKLVRNDATALQVLDAAYKEEREETGRRFVVRFRRGRLEIIPFRRNALLYTFEQEVTDLSFGEERRDHPVTALEGKGRVGKGKGAAKVSHTVADRDVVRRFGYVHKEKDYGRVSSRGALVDRVKRDYAEGIRARRTAEFSHPMIPFIRRGDTIRLLTDEPGWTGSSATSRDRSYAFVESISHSVTGAEQVSTLSVSQDDPIVADEERRDRERRARKRRKRKKR